MPISDIYGLRAAIDNIADDPGILTRHAKIAAASRKAITGAGLKLYLHSGYSNTVTVFEVPECTTAAAILDGVKKDYNIMLAGSFDGHPHRPHGKQCNFLQCTRRFPRSGRNLTETWCPAYRIYGRNLL